MAVVEWSRPVEKMRQLRWTFSLVCLTQIIRSVVCYFENHEPFVFIGQHCFCLQDPELSMLRSHEIGISCITCIS